MAEPTTPDQVARRYYAIAGLYNLSASLIWGVNTLFLLDAGLTLFETFVANAFFTAGMVLFEIPTGVVADTVGRRASFLASLATLFVGTLAYVTLAETGGGLFLFSLASIVLGLGFTFYSGAVEAWLVDAMRDVGHEGGLEHTFARGAQMQGAAMLIGTVGGGALGQIDLSLPYVVRAWLLAGLFLLAFWTMHDIGFQQRPFRLAKVPEEMRTIVQASLRHGWRKRPIRLMMGMNLLLFGFMMWGWYAWQPYFLDLLGRDLIWVAGVIAALVSVSMILGNQVAEPLVKTFRRRSRVLIAGAAVFSASMILTGFADSFYLAVGTFLVGTAAMGAVGPVRQAFLHDLIPSEVRATVISFDGLLSSAGGVVSQVGLGRYSQAQGIGPGYVLGGAVTLLALPLAFLLRRLEIPEDGKATCQIPDPMLEAKAEQEAVA